MEVEKANGRSICDPVRQPNTNPSGCDDEAARRARKAGKEKGAMAQNQNECSIWASVADS